MSGINNVDQLRKIYLDLLKKTLTGIIRSEREEYIPLQRFKNSGFKYGILNLFNRIISKKNYLILHKVPFDLEARINGKILPTDADTMIGLKRLNNLHQCIVNVFNNNIPGDLIETGGVERRSNNFYESSFKSLWSHQ